MASGTLYKEWHSRHAPFSRNTFSASCMSVRRINVGSVSGGVEEIDLDAFGLDENDELFFVRLVDVPGDGRFWAAARGRTLQ